MDEPQQVLLRDAPAEEFLVPLIPDLVGHHPDLVYADIRRQTLDPLIGLDAPGPGLDDHDELIHHGRGAPAQMLQPGLHVHHHHVVLPEDQRGQDGLEHHMLRAHAAGPAGVHGAHDQQLHAVDVPAQLVRQIGDLRIELVKGVALVGGGALLRQLLHLGDRNDGVDLLLRQAQCQSKIGIRVHVGGQNIAPLGGVETAEGGGEGGLPNPALASDGYFHRKSFF